ncbi:MAG: NAD(P)-dependent oxidoreductase, partial [bacterium]
MTQPRVAILGLGLMGSGMARRLLGAGFPLAVYNRTAEKAAPLVAGGARLARSPIDAATDADVVVSMLADDRASRAVWLGASGALAAMRSGGTIIESSTVTPAWVAELSAA